MKKVLDTNAVLYLLGGKLVDPLPAGEYVISVISEMELLSYPLLESSAQAAVVDFLSGIQIVPLNEQMKGLAIKLRRDHQLKLPDAIIVVTAMVLGATLVTNDVRLHKVPGISVERLQLK